MIKRSTTARPRCARHPLHQVVVLGGLVGLLGLAGCPHEPTPIAEDALGAYLSRHGITSAPAPQVDDEAAPVVVAPPQAAMARRLLLTVVSARDLPDLDAGPGVTDPYVILQIDGQRFRTTVIEGSLSPVWGDSFIVDIGPSPVLEITMKDEDVLASDETIGVVSLVLEPIAVGATTELEIPFREGAGGYLTLRFSGLEPRDGTRRP